MRPTDPERDPSGRGRGRGPSALSESLGTFLEEAGLARMLRAQEGIGRWAPAVGPAVAAVTRPVRVDGAVLFVQVRSPGWVSELHLRSREIIERLNEGVGEEDRIRKVVFSLGPGDSEG